jgi:cytochrome subunit of sulfide dehydrogenase
MAATRQGEAVPVGRFKPICVAVRMAVLASAFLVAAPVLAVDPQTLAVSCSGCHTNSPKLNTAIPRIRGRPAAVIVEAMHSFRSGRRPATVMDRIAKGFTDDEIKQMAEYFSGQK